MLGFRETEEQRHEREIAEAHERRHRLVFYVWAAGGAVFVGWILLTAIAICLIKC